MSSPVLLTSSHFSRYHVFCLVFKYIAYLHHPGSAVWQTMIILVYRPFVELGHLRDPGGEVAERAWQKCTKAADTMSDILRTHNETLGFRRAPFLISYCAYIAATIVSGFNARDTCLLGTMLIRCYAVKACENGCTKGSSLSRYASPTILHGGLSGDRNHQYRRV
jgi:hypothetical protein